MALVILTMRALLDTNIIPTNADICPSLLESTIGRGINNYSTPANIVSCMTHLQEITQDEFIIARYRRDSAFALTQANIKFFCIIPNTQSQAMYRRELHSRQIFYGDPRHELIDQSVIGELEYLNPYAPVGKIIRVDYDEDLRDTLENLRNKKFGKYS